MVRDNVLIITGCMKPGANVSTLKLTDSKERERQYVKALLFYIEHSLFEKIIYADNSDVPENPKVMECAKAHNKEMEWISFSGDSSKTETYGKGYGEGEIISYVVQNSKLIQCAQYITKITGRLIIKNINLFYRLAKKDKVYFQPSIFEDGRLYINTRLYMMPIQTYKHYFLKAYKRVNDREKVYLEHTFGYAVTENSLKYNRFVVYPNYLGISGSTGITYDSGFWKRLKNTLRMYRVK